jgi:two-component system, OmpR family, sensor histidine kinase VicK
VGKVKPKSKHLKVAKSPSVNFEPVKELRQAELQGHYLDLLSMEDVPVGVLILEGSDHIISFINPMICRFWDRTKEQAANKPLFEVLPEIRHSGYKELLDGVLSSGMPYFGTEVPATLMKGGRAEITYFNFVYNPLRDASGKVTGIMVIATDVTEGVKAKQQLAVERQRLEDLFMQAPAMVAILRGSDHVYELANPLYLQVAGKTADIIGKPVQEVFPELKGQGVLELLDKVYTSGEAFIGNEVLVKLDRQGTGRLEDFYFNFVYQPSRNVQGEVDGILVHGVEVTDQVKARQRAEESEGRFRTVVEQSPISIQIFAPSGRTIQVNPAWEQLWGVPREALGDYNILKDPQLAKKGVMPLIKRGFKGEVVHLPPVRYDPAEIGKPGRPRWIEATLYPIRGEANEVKELVLVHLDVTEAKLTQSELEDLVAEQTAELVAKNDELSLSEQQLSEAQDLAGLGSWEWDAIADDVKWSKALYQIFGVDPETKVDYQTYTNTLHPDDRQYVIEQIQEAVTGKRDEFTFEHRISRRDGEVRVVYSQGRAHRDEVGKFLKLSGTALDITERKRVEQLKADFVAMASHQLKTPAAIISGYADNLLSGIVGELTDKQREYIEDIKKVGTRNYNLIADLLSVSRIDRGVVSANLESIALDEVIELALANYREAAASKGLELTVKKGNKKVLVMADKAKLAEAIGNVIDNSIKFTSKGGITVSMRVEAGKAVAEVTDTGRGMSTETVSKLFQRDQIFSGGFAAENGSGLGLYITKEFMRAQHGDVTVRSKPRQGSTFTFTISLAGFG